MWRTGLVVVVAACGGPSATVAEPVTKPATAGTPNTPVAHGIVVLDHAPADAIALDVRAVRWACAVTHPHGVVTQDLRVPAGRAIKLVVRTPEWPQAAAGLEVSLVGTDVKQAVVKDHPVEIAFRVDEPGTYQWKCPTLVPPPIEPQPGVSISDEARASQDPIKPLIVMPAAEYDAMLAANDPSDPANQLALGRTLYEKKGCVACHTIDGSARIGPSWLGIWGTNVTLADGSTAKVDAAYVTTSILHPQAFARPGFPPAMPSFEGQLRDGEIAALVTFIASLKKP